MGLNPTVWGHTILGAQMGYLYGVTASEILGASTNASYVGDLIAKGALHVGATTHSVATLLTTYGGPNTVLLGYSAPLVLGATTYAHAVLAGANLGANVAYYANGYRGALASGAYYNYSGGSSTAPSSSQLGTISIGGLAQTTYSHIEGFSSTENLNNGTGWILSRPGFIAIWAH